MEKLKEIVNGSKANLTHICNGKVYFQIETENHKYQLEIDSLSKDWNNVHIESEYKAITLMRWIKKGIDKDNGTFIKLI
jgi:hypothetical protein